MVNSVIGQLGAGYKAAIAAGFPEARAWELVNKLIDKAFESMMPLFEKIVEKDL